jgi:IS4 transposase
MEVRRILVKLNRPTRTGEQEIALFCNWPVAITASKIAEIYQARWGIETAFQKLPKYLNFCTPHSGLSESGFVRIWCGISRL